MTTTTVDLLSTALADFPTALPALVILLKITCVLLAALGATLLMQRAPAGARHLIWLVTLAGLLILPALAVWAPLPMRVLPAAFAAKESPAPVAEQPSRETPSLRSGRAAEPPSRVTAAPPTSLDLRTTLLLIWALGAGLLLLRLVHGAWSVHRIVRRARVLEHRDWQTPLYQIADRLQLDAAPVLLQSDLVKMPFASGLFTHRIVLPVESEEWSAERRSAVLIHELGHVRRRDLIGHTLSRIVCAVYWFHPLVWTAARQLRAESERACDDLALVFGARPSEYAEHLLEIVSCVRDHNTPAIALAMAHRKEFEGRMLAILNPELRRRGPSRMETASLAGSLAILALLVGAASPMPRQAPEYRAVLQPLSDTLEQAGDTGPRPVTQAAPVSGTPSPRPMPEPDPQPRAQPVPAAKPQPAATPERMVTGDSVRDERSELLVKTLRTDQNAEVRRVAAWGLQRYARTDAAAVEALSAAAVNDANDNVRETAAWALGSAHRNTTASAALARLLKSEKSAAVRSTAVWALGSIGDGSTVDAVLPSLGDADPDVREMAVWAVGSSHPESAPAALIRLLSDQDREVRMAATWALYTIRDPKALPAIKDAFERETDPDIKSRLITAMGGFGELSVAALQRMISSGDNNTREDAVNALARGSDPAGPWPWPRPRPRPFP